MAEGTKIWLVYNRASGSNDAAALREVEAGLERAGYAIARRSCFPQEAAPDARALDAAGIATCCIFAGDGTVHSVLADLSGWSGAVLVLPGGTMNLLSLRLHGEGDAPAILDRLARTPARRERPQVLHSRHGMGFTGALAGPGTAWNVVREAMRDTAVGTMATATVDAAVRSVYGPPVTCAGLPGARREGYTAISINPTDEGIAVNGYYAEGPGDMAGHVAAMLQGDFRDGPHDELGAHPQVEISAAVDEPMSLLIDGEPFEAAQTEVFTLARCDIDLLATRDAA